MLNNSQLFINLQKNTDKILKLREQGMSYKKLAKRFGVELWVMKNFLGKIEVDRIDNIFSDLRLLRRGKLNEIQNNKINKEGDTK